MAANYMQTDSKII